MSQEKKPFCLYYSPASVFIFVLSQISLTCKEGTKKKGIEEEIDSNWTVVVVVVVDWPWLFIYPHNDAPETLAHHHYSKTSDHSAISSSFLLSLQQGIVVFVLIDDNGSWKDETLFSWSSSTYCSFNLLKGTPSPPALLFSLSNPINNNNNSILQRRLFMESFLFRLIFTSLHFFSFLVPIPFNRFYFYFKL